MAKYNKEIIETIVQALEKGQGRIQACKTAGIHYQTFLNWLSDETKTNFLTQVKKAEKQGSYVIKETCENVIMRAATQNDKPVWQAAAWMLERKFPDEYSIKQSIDHTTKGDKITNEDRKNILDDLEKGADT